MTASWRRAGREGPGSGIGDVRRRRDRRWRVLERDRTMRSHPTAPRRDDQSGRRRIHAARQRQGDPRPPLPLDAVMRRFGSADSGQGRSIAHRLGRSGGTVPNPHPSRPPPPTRGRSVHRRADGRLDRRPQVRRTASIRDEGSPFTATFSATVRYQSRPNSRTAFTEGQITFSTRPGTNTAITAALRRPLQRVLHRSSSPWAMRRGRTRANGRRRRSRPSRTA